MEFTEIKIYDIIEENLVDGQLITEVETDVNSVSYSLESSYNQYFSVQENKVYLTGDGKDAINTDYPEDINKEIQQLNFTIIATDMETDASISQNISIKVQRIIDNAPYVLNHFEHNMYTHNLYPNMLTAKIDLVYNTFCTIVGTNASYFDIDPIPSTGMDNITIRLNNNGINLYSNFDFDSLDPDDIELIENRRVYKVEIILNLIDATNKKSTVFSIFAKFVEGDQYQNLPTKNNLEIQAELLATKISEILTKYDDTINEYSFDISNLKRKVSVIGSQLNLNRTQINKLTALLQESIDESKQVFEYTDDKIKVIVKSLYDMYDVIYGTITDFLKSETNSDLENKASMFQDLKTVDWYDKAEKISSQGFSEYLMLRTDLQIERRFENYTDTINEMFVKFRSLINSNIISPFTLKDNELAVGVNDLYAQLALIGNIAAEAKARVFNADDNIKYLDNRLQFVESFNLEDWGDDGAWKFYANTLQYNGNDVLSYSNTEIDLHHSNRITCSTDDGNMYWDGDTLTFDNASGVTVDAGTFTGTATTAKYADLAEYYKKENHEDYMYESGTILYFNRSKDNEDFEVTENAKGNIYCGIVTTNPGFVLNSTFENNQEYVNIALNGRVPVKCEGLIKKGMYLYPSHNNPNVAEGTYTYKNTIDLIGVALENSDPSSLENFKILCKVK